MPPRTFSHRTAFPASANRRIGAPLSALALAFLLTLLLGAGNSCSALEADEDLQDDPQEEPLENSLAAVEAAPGEPFMLAVGQEARLGTTEPALLVHFDRVENDSRCPKDVQCVWAGDATVVLTVTASGQGPVQVVLHTLGDANHPNQAQAAGHDFRLEELSPYPEAGTPIPQDAYRARLVVTPGGTRDVLEPDPEGEPAAQ